MQNDSKYNIFSCEEGVWVGHHILVEAKKKKKPTQEMFNAIKEDGQQKTADVLDFAGISMDLQYLLINYATTDIVVSGAWDECKRFCFRVKALYVPYDKTRCRSRCPRTENWSTM